MESLDRSPPRRSNAHSCDQSEHPSEYSPDSETSASSPRSACGRTLYLAALKPSLEASLCLLDFPSQNIERHNKPEIEVRMSPELLLNPITVCRGPHERVTIEGSINSTRVSLFYWHSDPHKRILRRKFLSFMTRRAEQFMILRKKPVAGYDVSFLITNCHLQILHKHKVVDFILHFIEDLDKEVSELKLALNTRARICAKMYLNCF